MGFLLLAQQAWSMTLSAISWLVMMFTKHWRVVLIFIGIVFVLATFALLAKSCRDRKIAERDRIIEEADKAVRDARLAKELSNSNQAKKEAVNASKQSNEALENVNTTRTTDSRNFNGDERSARERFCRNYPDDSQCRPR